MDSYGIRWARETLGTLAFDPKPEEKKKVGVKTIIKQRSLITENISSRKCVMKKLSLSLQT